MASVVTSPTSAPSVNVHSKPLHAAPESSVVVNAPPGREQVRMGRAATVPSGVTWLTLSVIIFFHAGSLAAFFFFSWSRLAVMAVLYVLAINVGIGMCYHRLLTHRGYQTPKWVEYVMSICPTLSLAGSTTSW